MIKTFMPNIFEETFNSYFRKWFIFSTVCFCLGFSMYIVTKLNIIGHMSHDLPTFLYPSPPPSFLYNVVEFFGDSDVIGHILFGATNFGVFSIGPVAVGLVAIGGVSFGLVAIGGVSFGLVAIGGVPFGLVAIGEGKNRFSTAIGLVAMSTRAYGVYTLSCKGTGRYCFSPSRQDPAAVALFTTLLPKLKSVFHFSTNGYIQNDFL